MTRTRSRIRLWRSRSTPNLEMVDATRGILTCIPSWQSYCSPSSPYRLSSGLRVTRSSHDSTLGCGLSGDSSPLHCLLFCCSGLVAYLAREDYFPRCRCHGAESSVSALLPLVGLLPT